MGRPLNKKYFGNRNIGTNGNEGQAGGGQNFADDKIGGEGLASIDWSNLGSFRGNDGAHNPLVGMALPAPTLPGGVQAEWTVTLEVASVTTGAGIAGLNVGDTYTYAGLGSPVFTVASTPLGGNATFTVTNRGSVDLADLPGDTQTVSMTKLTGSGANTFTVDINFRVKTATITEKGSGYTGAETFTVTLYTGGVGTPPAGTIVLTEDSGVTNGMNAEGNNENAIVAYGYVDGGREVVDIIRQTNGKSYKIEGADGIVRSAKLVAAEASDDGEMDINATDFGGGTYWVTKLSGRKATVVQSGSGPWEFDDGASVPWTFEAAPRDVELQSGYNVKIDNA